MKRLLEPTTQIWDTRSKPNQYRTNFLPLLSLLNTSLLALCQLLIQCWGKQMLIMTRIPNTNQQWADYSLVGVMLVADMVLCRGGKANCCDNLHSDRRQSALLQHKHGILFHKLWTTTLENTFFATFLWNLCLIDSSSSWVK